MIHVILRKYPGFVIALFPTIPGDYSPNTCLTFTRLGGFDEISYAECMSTSTPALLGDYRELLKDLRNIIGFRSLKVVKRRSSKMESSRKNQLI